MSRETGPARRPPGDSLTDVHGPAVEGEEREKTLVTGWPLIATTRRRLMLLESFTSEYAGGSQP